MASRPATRVWALLLLAASCATAQAAKCPSCGAPCDVPMVEKTVCVPVTDYVHKKVMCTEFSVETRMITRTVMVPQPRVITVQKTCTVLVPKTVQKPFTREVCKPVIEVVEETCVVCVPKTEIRRGTRQVCEMVPVTKTRKVCLDEGSWQEVEVDCPPPCGGCGPCQKVCRRVWVPKIVEKEVEYCTYQRVVKEVPYECEVTVMEPQTRTMKVERCVPHFECVTEMVDCLVLVPTQVTRDVEVCTWDCMPVERTVPCTVVVPHRVEREIVVPVCRMVEKKVMVPACPPPCCP